MSKTLGERLADLNIEVGTAITTDWQQVRIQAAIAAMQGFIGVPQMPFGHIAEEAVKVADALVAELQKKYNNADVQQ